MREHRVVTRTSPNCCRSPQQQLHGRWWGHSGHHQPLRTEQPAHKRRPQLVGPRRYAAQYKRAMSVDHGGLHGAQILGPQQYHGGKFHGLAGIVQHGAAHVHALGQAHGGGYPQQQEDKDSKPHNVAGLVRSEVPGAWSQPEFFSTS